MYRGGFPVAVVALLWAAPAAAQTQCSTPDMPLRPLVATHTMPPYPEMSVMTSEQGTSLLEVAVGPDGAPTGTKVVQSSGSPRLDDAAQDFVKSSWRWQAPTKDCKPVAAVTRISIKWSLQNAPQAVDPRYLLLKMKPADYPPGALEKRERGDAVISLGITAAGLLSRWTLTKSTGFADLDNRSLDFVKGQRWTPALMGGTPVPTILAIAVIWEPDGAPPAPGH